VDLFSTAVPVDGAGDIEAEAEDVVVVGAVVVYEDEDEVATAVVVVVGLLLGTLGVAAAVVAGR